MAECKKYGIKVTGCSKWSGGDTTKICDLCISEVEPNRVIAPSKRTIVRNYCNIVKTMPAMVKTIPFFEIGGESECKRNK